MKIFCRNCWGVIVEADWKFPATCRRRCGPVRQYSLRSALLPRSKVKLICLTWNPWLAAFRGQSTGYKVVIEKSTVPVYTSDWIRKIILRNAAPPDSFDVASNPEFLREGSAVTDFLYPDRIVVGADSERCASLLREIYAPLSDGSYYQRPDAIPKPDRARIPPPLIVTSAKSAELIKHASNAFLAMKISFINAVASICETVGANVQQVVQGIGSDSRIGPRFLN